MWRMVFVTFAFLGYLPLLAFDGFAVGDTVVLVERKKADGSELGVPGHAQAGQIAVTEHIPSGSSGKVLELGTGHKGHWLKIQVGTKEHWIVSKYVANVLLTEETSSGYVVGCWNIEYLSSGSSRGFPENTYVPAGPTYPSRTSAMLEQLAHTISTTLRAKLMVLEEIGGNDVAGPDGDHHAVSPGLEAVLSHLPGTWGYHLGTTGSTQRIGLLYDATAVRVNEVIELSVPPIYVENKDIFSRDPLAAHVTFLQGGAPRNDLVVVGLHLASGQENERNHDAAMAKLLQLLSNMQAQGHLGGPSEHDILLLGDLNANMFAPPVEQFFLDMDDHNNRFDVLADNSYPATRLKGVPLVFGDPIDYIIASRSFGSHKGLSGEEITVGTATVHQELPLAIGFEKYREALSDHLPVTVEIRIVEDSDP